MGMLSLGGGDSPAVVHGGWAPSLEISAPPTEIRGGLGILSDWCCWAQSLQVCGPGVVETHFSKDVQVVSCLVDSR